jgi:AcrR family transcriptional regulator
MEHTRENKRENTRDRIVAAASKLFYREGIRTIGMDLIAETAGVTKRTLYYYFRSKDDLVAAHLESRDQPNMLLFQKWFATTEGELAEKTRGIFINLAKSARHPKWKGCGFLRTTAELANMPGHPAVQIGAAHKKKFESWIQEQINLAGMGENLLLARQIMLLLDGSFAVSLLHRDASYMETAGEAAYTLIKAMQPGAT